MGCEAGAGAGTPPLVRRYGTLGDYLTARAAAGTSRVDLSFAAVETILGRALPTTARHRHGYRDWWLGYGGVRVHAWYGWQRAGWWVAAVDLAAETVTFARPPGTE